MPNNRKRLIRELMDGFLVDDRRDCILNYVHGDERAVLVATAIGKPGGILEKSKKNGSSSLIINPGYSKGCRYELSPECVRDDCPTWMEGLDPATHGYRSSIGIDGCGCALEFGTTEMEKKPPDIIGDGKSASGYNGEIFAEILAYLPDEPTKRQKRKNLPRSEYAPCSTSSRTHSLQNFTIVNVLPGN